jgi:hypothetical protein
VAFQQVRPSARHQRIAGKKRSGERSRLARARRTRSEPKGLRRPESGWRSGANQRRDTEGIP